jgi:hypothetical protein
MLSFVDEGKESRIEGNYVPFIPDSGPSLASFWDSGATLPRGENFHHKLPALLESLIPLLLTLFHAHPLSRDDIIRYSDADVTPKFTRYTTFSSGNDTEISD